MQTEAVVDGNQRGIHPSHAGVVVDGAVRKLAPQRQQQSQMAPISRLLAAGFADALSKTCTAPLARLTTLFQTKVSYYRGIWHALRIISQEEGILGLYKGIGATLLGSGGVRPCDNEGPTIQVSLSAWPVAVFQAMRHQQRKRVWCSSCTKYLT